MLCAGESATPLLDEAGEEVGGLHGGLGVGRGGEGVVLRAGALLEVGLEALHQRELRGVGAEGLELALLDAADIEGDCPGRGQRRGAAGKEEAGGGVVEALGGVRGAEGGEALGSGGQWKAAVVKKLTMEWSAWVLPAPSPPKVRTTWGR